MMAKYLIINNKITWPSYYKRRALILGESGESYHIRIDGYKYVYDNPSITMGRLYGSKDYHGIRKEDCIIVDTEHRIKELKNV